jgi:transposase
MLDNDRETKSALTENRMSARGERIELITRGERRRSWSLEEKREIAAESLVAGVVAAAVARKHGIGTGLLYTWRRQFLDGAFGAVTSVSPSFMRVDVVEAIPRETGEGNTSALADTRETPSAPDSSMAFLRRGGLIEIIPRGGVSVCVDAQVDEVALRRVLSSLERR